MPPDLNVLTAVILCPNCGMGLEGVWLAPEAGDAVEPCLHECGECARQFTAEWPGYSFTAEA